MRFALDTNIIVYAEGVNGERNYEAALRLLAELPRDDTVLPLQVLGELFSVLVGKANRSRTDARQVLLNWSDLFPIAATTPSAMWQAVELSVDHGLRIWDAVILSVAAEAGCRVLLSEDMHEGFMWRGVMITNPFAATRHPLLESMLGGDGFHEDDTSFDG